MAENSFYRKFFLNLKLIRLFLISEKYQSRFEHARAHVRISMTKMARPKKAMKLDRKIEITETKTIYCRYFKVLIFSLYFVATEKCSTLTTANWKMRLSQRRGISNVFVVQLWRELKSRKTNESKIKEEKNATRNKTQSKTMRVHTQKGSQMWQSIVSANKKQPKSEEEKQSIRNYEKKRNR